MEEACVICKENPIEQEHHLSYKPPITIEVCVSCHSKLHRHGVGRGQGKTKEPDVRRDNLGKWTYCNPEDFRVYYRSTDEIMWSIACGCKQFKNGVYDVEWRLFSKAKDERNILFLRCMLCGQDYPLLRMYDKEQAKSVKRREVIKYAKTTQSKL